MTWTFLLLTSGTCVKCDAMKESDLFTKQILMKTATDQGFPFYHLHISGTNNTFAFTESFQYYSQLTSYTKENVFTESKNHILSLKGHLFEKLKGSIGLFFPYLLAFRTIDFQNVINNQNLDKLPVAVILVGINIFLTSSIKDERYIISKVNGFENKNKSYYVSFIETITSETDKFAKLLAKSNTNDIEEKEPASAPAPVAVSLPANVSKIGLENKNNNTEPDVVTENDVKKDKSNHLLGNFKRMNIYKKKNGCHMGPKINGSRF